jgi:hypothetical protein
MLTSCWLVVVGAVAPFLVSGNVQSSWVEKINETLKNYLFCQEMTKKLTFR